MSAEKKKETWGWIERPGRFIGDLEARLQTSDIETKWRYRVEVCVWTWFYDEDTGKYESWAKSSDALRDDDWAMRKGGYKPVRYFKSLEKAIAYLTDIRADAERRGIKIDLRETRKHGWETIA